MNQRITSEPLPNPFSSVSSNSASPNNEGPISKRRKRGQKTRGPPGGKVETKQHREKYLIGDKYVEHTFRELRYKSKTGQKNPDPNSHRTQKKEAPDEKKKRKGDGRKGTEGNTQLERKRQERARCQRGNGGNCLFTAAKFRRGDLRTMWRKSKPYLGG